MPLLLTRNKEFVPGKYGPAGGAICSRCALPFSRSLLAPNLVTGKLVRCPHCGKTAILPRAPLQQLKEAEARLTRDGESLARSSQQDNLEKLIEESRFED